MKLESSIHSRAIGKCSKVQGSCQNNFRYVHQHSEVFGKLLEVARTFSEIPVMRRQKSYTFDSVNTGRYITLTHCMCLVKKFRRVKMNILGLHCTFFSSFTPFASFLTFFFTEPPLSSFFADFGVLFFAVLAFQTKR